MTTEAAPRRRLPRPVVRAWAWLAAAVSFLVPAAAIGAQPEVNPVPAAAARPVVVRRIIRRVVHEAAAAPVPVRTVYVPAAPVSAPAPATSTGGS